MPRVNAPLLAFNRGEVSKIALARVDLAKLQLAAECQLNWEPKVIGPMGLRPGLQYVGEVLGDNKARLLPFVFAFNDTALLELTNGQIRFWINDVLVTRPSVATSISDPFFAGGGSWVTSDTTSGASTTIAGGVLTLTCTPVGGLARAKQAITVAGGDLGKEHGIRLVVTNGPVTVRAGSSDGLSDIIAQTVLDTGTHALACTPSSNINLQIESTDAWNKTLSSVTIDAAGTLQIPTPWGTGDLPHIRQTQSGDIIFVAAYGLQQYKIERRATHGWSVVLYRSSNGPLQSSPALTANFTPSVFYGNGTLTSDRPYFQSGHVGCLFQLFSNGQANQTLLGNQNAFTPAVRVVGVGTTARNYNWNVSGTYVGVLTLQRSFDGPDSGFVDVASAANGATGTPVAALASSTGSSGGTPDLDNAIAWERVGFKAGNYTSGNATVASTYTGGGGFAIVRVVAPYISATQVNIEILNAFSSLTATTDWLEQDWSNVIGFPTAGDFFEGRLTWTGRDEMWFSQSNDFVGYASQDLQGNPLGDAGVIIEQFGAGPVDSVNWMLSLTRAIFGREMSVASARSSSFDEVLTPTNFSVKDCATQGAARLPALKIDKRGVFVALNGRVYNLVFDAQSLDYTAHDMTRLNLDIFAPGFVDLAVARQPDTAEYFVRGDGLCAVQLDDPDDDVQAWYRMQTLGIIENVCVLPPGVAGVEDQVYFVVRRVINGVTRRFIEKLAPRANCVGGTLNQLLDCHVVYNGAPASSITIAQLPNTTVSVWADGAFIGTGTTNGSGVLTPLPDGLSHSVIVAGLAGSVQTYSGAATATFTGLSAFNGLTAEVFADQQPSGRMVKVGTLTVSGGTLTLPANWQAANIVAYFGFMAPFMSAKLAYAAQMGSPLTQKKKIDHVGLVMFDTHAQGLQFGQRFDHLDSMPLYEEGAAVTAGTVWSEYDEPMVEVPGEWDTDARLCLLGQAPYPCKVGGVVVAVQTNEKG
jgi:hypothetical protein